MSRDWKTVLDEHEKVIGGLRDSEHVLAHIVEEVVNCLRAGRRVYTLGNGGSAADAQHIACELLGRFKLDRLAQAAIAISTDSSTLTAIANDLGYDQIFSRQLEGLLQTGDVVWLLSTSGNSPNVINAANTARTYGATLIGFTGGTGGELEPLCHLTFKVPHKSSDRIQEAHALAYHYICERVEAELA
ncbi:MAG: SIS domain-containing protein [Phycisphaerae bacterium]|nr:SIS domain-containing protein [Phycisphaerae bacterium]